MASTTATALENAKCSDTCAIVYQGTLTSSRRRAAFLERRLTPASLTFEVSEDVRRNLPVVYERLFSSRCRAFLDRLYDDAMEAMRGVPIQQCAQAIEALAVVQEIVAVALWKYNLAATPSLEQFARTFDRLDDEGERRALHEHAQIRGAD